MLKVVRTVRKIVKHPVYWIRYAFSSLFLFPGFWITDLGAKICVVGNKLQDLAIAIEGDIPDDDDYVFPGAA
jgi:hypothetical protein